MSHDLHTHSTFSDGLSTPHDLARMAWAAGLRGLAVSDHDTTAHFDQAADACETYGLEWIPAIELSAEVPPAPGGGHTPRSVHLLGYWVGADGPLGEELARLAVARRDRALAMVQRLNDHGADIDPAGLVAASAATSLGRPHVARLMVSSGLVSSVREAFASWLGEDKPAYVPKGALHPVRCVELIRAAGGAAVLAHPTWGGVDRGLLDAMCTAGLAGVELPREDYEPDAARAWRRIAADRGLVVALGTDFHGEAQSVTLGSLCTAVPMVEALRARTEGEVSHW